MVLIEMRLTVAMRVVVAWILQLRAVSSVLFENFDFSGRRPLRAVHVHFAITGFSSMSSAGRRAA